MAPSDRTRFAPNSPAARDIEYYLHPFTNLKLHEENGPLIVNEGKGIYVYDDQGNEIIEGMAGLWCTSLGLRVMSKPSGRLEPKSALGSQY